MIHKGFQWKPHLPIDMSNKAKDMKHTGYSQDTGLF